MINSKQLYIWRILLLGSVISATVISGSFLERTIGDGWQRYVAWIISPTLAFGVYAGIGLVTRGIKLGWLVVTLLGILEVIFDLNYLNSDEHGMFVSVAVGITPMTIAFVCGLIESQYSVLYETKEESREDKAYQRRQQEKKEERIHEINLERVKANKEVKLAQMHNAPLVHNGAHNGAPSKLNGAQRKADMLQRIEAGEEINKAQWAREYGVHRNTIGRDIKSLNGAASVHHE